MKYLAATIIFIQALSGSVNVFGQTDGQWTKIAEKTVSYNVEKDVVSPKGENKNVDKLRIKCIQGTVRLRKVVVEMSDGEKKEYDAKGTGVLSKGMTSFSWDLPGKPGEHKLTKIELHYDSVGGMFITKKAKVEIEGRVVN